MSAESPHWFSDIDPDETLTTHRWQPCLETYAGHVPSIPVWFASESDCDEWIAANLATPHDLDHAVASERAKVERVRELHQMSKTFDLHIRDGLTAKSCTSCKTTMWPCPTSIAIESGAHNHAQDGNQQDRQVGK